LQFISLKIFSVLAVILQFGLSAQAVAQPDSDPLMLTEEEREWISANPVVRVGGELDWAPYDFVNERGQYTGIANDFLKVISERTGLQFEVETDAWKNLVAKMKAGHIDLLPALYYSPERDEHFHFTSKYLQVTDYVFARDDTGVTSEEDLAGRTVATLKGSVSVDRFREASPDVRILELESIEAVIHAVKTYKADILFDELTTVSFWLRQESITNIHPVFTFTGSQTNDIFMASRQGLPQLSSLISRVLESMSESEKQAIISSWKNSAQGGGDGDGEDSGPTTSAVVYWFLAAALLLLAVFFVFRRSRKH